MKKNNPSHKAQAGTRRSIQKEETRRIILESSRVLFNELGFEKTSTRAIAENAGVGVGTVFSHFLDKQSLLIAALLDDLACIQEEALKTLPANLCVSEQFIHLSKYFYSYYAKHPDLSRTLLKEMWFASGDWGERLLSQAHQFVLFLNTILEEAKQKEEIRPETDTMLCARAFFSNYLNVLFEGLSEAEINTDKMIDMLRSLQNQLFNGVGTNK